MNRTSENKCEIGKYLIWGTPRLFWIIRSIWPCLRVFDPSYATLVLAHLPLANSSLWVSTSTTQQHLMSCHLYRGRTPSTPSESQETRRLHLRSTHMQPGVRTPLWWIGLFFLCPLYELSWDALAIPSLISHKRGPSRSNNQLCLIPSGSQFGNSFRSWLSLLPMPLPLCFTPASLDLHSWKKAMAHKLWPAFWKT